MSEEQKEREGYKGKEKRESQKRPNGRQRESEKERENSRLKDNQREGLNPWPPLPSSILLNSGVQMSVLTYEP